MSNDAWNRLVSVHTAHLNGGDGIVLDLLVKHHSYDAIGRLARTLSPYPSPAQQSGGALRSERFYYDGIRRLVEVQIDTIKSLAGALASGNQTYINLANDALDLSDGDIDQSAAPAAYEVAYIAAASPTITTTREYIWGPGDRGIYELIMQFDASNARLWVMQDEGGDVAAACDAGGVNNQLRLVGLWSYGPYGEVTMGASLLTHAPIHAGHKGLFVDRLDAGVAGIGGAETARLATGATHAVFANNRHLLPKLGRWAQQDPNASGLVTLAVGYSGQGMGVPLTRFGFAEIYGDDPNLYQCLGSSPWMRHDPLGLYWMDALAADMAAGALTFAQVTIPRLLVQHYAKMIIASELAAGLAMGDANPSVGSVWGAGAEDALLAMRGFANGRFATNMLDAFSSGTFRANALKLWDMEGDRVIATLKTHHIIPQWEKVMDIMNRLRVGDMVHNPLFSAFLKEADHQILHAGGANGGWYNRMWLTELNRIEGLGLQGNDAAKAIIDIIGNRVYPAMREALARGGPPPGY